MALPRYEICHPFTPQVNITVFENQGAQEGYHIDLKDFFLREKSD